MDDLLKHRKRVLLSAYRRYLAADRAWVEANDMARAWVRTTPKPVVAIGTPRSRMRSLYDQRERALARLHAARLKLEIARTRLETRKTGIFGISFAEENRVSVDAF